MPRYPQLKCPFCPPPLCKTSAGWLLVDHYWRSEEYVRLQLFLVLFRVHKAVTLRDGHSFHLLQCWRVRFFGRERYCWHWKQSLSVFLFLSVFLCKGCNLVCQDRLFLPKQINALKICSVNTKYLFSAIEFPKTISCYSVILMVRLDLLSFGALSFIVISQWQLLKELSRE